MMVKLRLNKFLLVALSALGMLAEPLYSATPQRVTVKGVVRDLITNEPLSYVTVAANKKGGNTLTDSLGFFSIRVPNNATIQLNSVGYRTEELRAPFGLDTLQILLEPSTTELSELIVKPKKQKYSKKNPAVDLMQKVRANYHKLRPDKVDGYNYDTYEKMVLALNSDDNNKGTWIIPVRDKQKLQSHADTALWTGDKIFVLSVKEKTGVHLRDKGKDVDVITASRNDGMDESLSKEYTNIIFEDMLRQVDVYDNDIMLLKNAFVSPLSRIADDFYKFEITDTVMIGTDRCVELSFAPHTAEMSGFNGKLYVPADDSLRYVRRVMMRMPKAANINYVKSLVLSQNYKLDSLGKINKTLDDLVATLQVIPGMPKFYISRQTRRENFGYEGRPEYNTYIERIGNKFELADAEGHDDTYWDQSRMLTLTHGEKTVFSKQSAFKNDKLFRAFKFIVNVVSRRYIPTGPEKYNYFNLGPILSVISYNKPEGWRLELGGMTTSKVSPHFWISGYGAYGFGDHKWKGRGMLEYSFEKKDKTPMEFPINSIKAGYQYDIESIGLFKDPESSALLSSWRTSQNNFYIYQHKAFAEYVKEWRNHVTLSVGFRYTRQIPTAETRFVNGFGKEYGQLHQAAFSVSLRWAPEEKFTQSLDLRSPVNRDGWVFVLKHEYGPKRFLGSDFSLSRTDLAIDKGFWLSSFGYMEWKIRASKIWTQVPYTELCWPPANTSYFTDGHSFVLMNPMEFAMDQYAMWDMQYHAKGLLLDRIPFIKKARFREFISFKGIFSGLSRKNNPARAQGALRFPGDKTTVMNATPYMECSVGIENILTFLRVEYVWRLTYRNRPDISRGGVRLGFHVTF